MDFQDRPITSSLVLGWTLALDSKPIMSKKKPPENSGLEKQALNLTISSRVLTMALEKPTGFRNAIVAILGPTPAGQELGSINVRYGHPALAEFLNLLSFISRKCASVPFIRKEASDSPSRLPPGDAPAVQVVIPAARNLHAAFRCTNLLTSGVTKLYIVT